MNEYQRFVEQQVGIQIDAAPIVAKLEEVLDLVTEFKRTWGGASPYSDLLDTSVRTACRAALLAEGGKTAPRWRLEVVAGDDDE